MDILFKMALYIHVFSGAISLFLGMGAMAAPKKKGNHTKIGNLYFYFVSAVCLSAGILSLINWEQSNYLFFIAIFSYAFALRGYRAAKNKKEGWLKRHIQGMLGSYIAMVTAFLVVSGQHIPGINQVPPLYLWLIPSAIGVPASIFVRRKLGAS